VKIKVRRRQSKDGIWAKIHIQGKAKRHNRSGFKANQATTNGVFRPKNLQINIVQKRQFLYNFPTWNLMLASELSVNFYAQKI
jgi:hypothetical protein